MRVQHSAINSQGFWEVILATVERTMFLWSKLSNLKNLANTTNCAEDFHDENFSFTTMNTTRWNSSCNLLSNLKADDKKLLDQFPSLKCEQLKKFKLIYYTKYAIFFNLFLFYKRQASDPWYKWDYYSCFRNWFLKNYVENLPEH